MKLGSAKAWAHTLGSGLAHLQHGIDKLVEHGCEFLQEAGSTPEAAPKTSSSNFQGAKAFGKSALRFLGQLGENYYRKYEELKRKH